MGWGIWFVTALVKLFRTTAFKLALLYLVIVALGAASVLGVVGWTIGGLFDQQIAQTVEVEITGLTEQYAQGGIRQLVESVERRSRQPGSSLYLVTNFAGQSLSGNITALPGQVLAREGVVETSYKRQGDIEASHRALARVFVLSGGFRLLVGRDLAEREAFRAILRSAFVSSLLALTAIGTLGGLYVARKVLRRVDALSDSAASIMQGDMARRLPLAGTGDELDRLAQNLNAMLERIDGLMTGLQQVSDNIAHDLKTPLTRLRNGAEQALRATASPQDHQAALEKIIEESDSLIRVFNALLMIARAEAGSGRDGMADFDAGEVAREIAELYEPVAEEGGARVVVAAQAALLHGSRELIGQALANLLDNALKYGLATQDAQGQGMATIEVTAKRTGGMVEIGVGDHGSGIAPGDRARVQERFVRLETSRSRPGSGLGLSLAAAVARLHGGSLRLEDNAPGLRVVLALPAAMAGT